MANIEIKHFSHKVGVNVHHFEWCTKYRYQMLKKDEYKKFCEDTLRVSLRLMTADIIFELFSPVFIILKHIKRGTGGRK